MTFPFALITALLISMAVIPLMMRLAPALGMVDVPDPRKVHAIPVPRVGGIGIVLGSLLSIVLWMPLDGWLPWYVIGSLVLLLFGAMDDSRELGHYVKFVGQFVATIAVVYGGDLWVAHFPFVAEPLSPELGKPFTVFAIVGMINAINHSDGLDGLAGGESLLSFGCLAYLGYLSQGIEFVILVGAVAGGLFGFLRYNTYPARVFMGDSGSQYLGFSLAALTVYLTQQVNTGVSMALPLLILGLPIVDILVVFAQRVRSGMNWFRATRNHVHHRLLELGFQHHQAVLIIYAIQASLVLAAVFLRFESDALVLGVYLAVCGLLFALIWLAETRGWRVSSQQPDRSSSSFIEKIGGNSRVLAVPLGFVQFSVPVYFLFAVLAVDEVSADIGVAGALIAIGMLAIMLFWRRGWDVSMLSRLGIYSTASLLVYSVTRHLDGDSGQLEALLFGYFILLVAAIAMAVRFASEREFHTTPLDYLLVFTVVAGGIAARGQFPDFDLGAVVLQLAVLFYASELVVSRGSRGGIGFLNGAALLAALGLALRATF